jgi:hypothetical protein
MKFTTKSTSGTSFFGTTIRTTVNNLIENIGEPNFEENSGKDKVNFEWELETESGKVFTIYDWKEYRSIGWDEEIEFHIGGMNRGSCDEALEELERLI